MADTISWCMWINVCKRKEKEEEERKGGRKKGEVDGKKQRGG